MKKFIQFLKDLSVKQTIVLTGFGITLFIVLLQGITASVATGQSAAIEMAVTIWFGVILSTIIISIVFLIVIFIITLVIKKIVQMFKNKKSKKQDKKKATS